MGDVVFTTTAGQQARAYRRGAVSGDPVDQYVIPVLDRITSFRGRANSFRTVGIAGTAGHKIGSIFNATGSTVLVDVERIIIDTYATAAKAVAPPIARAHRITALPGGGTALTKLGMDTSQSSSASVTLLQATASDGGAATAITGTPAANTILAQQLAPRALTVAGYEMVDQLVFFDQAESGPLTLRALEGVMVNLDYTVATSSPITDMYHISFYWTEYTRP